MVQNWRSLQVTKLQRRVFIFVAVPHAILNKRGSDGGRKNKTFEIQFLEASVMRKLRGKDPNSGEEKTGM